VISGENGGMISVQQMLMTASAAMFVLLRSLYVAALVV